MHQFTDHITDLSQAVDVYSDWIDACDAVAKEAASGMSRAPPAGAHRGALDDEPTIEDDGFIEDDEGDGEAAYAED